MPFYIEMKGNNKKLHEINTKLKRIQKARKSQQAMKSYRRDFFFELDFFLLIKHTCINKEKHTKRILHGGAKIRISFSRGKNNILLTRCVRSQNIVFATRK